MARSFAGNLLDHLGDLRAQRRLEARLDLVEVAFDREHARRQRAVDHRHRDLEPQMPGQHALLAQGLKDEIRIDGVAREAEPPARVAEPHPLDAVAHLELPAVRIVVRKLALDPVVGARMRENLELRVGGEHLVVDAADPVAARSDLAVRHRRQVTSERRAESLEHVLRRIEWNAAHQQKLIRHRLSLKPRALRVSVALLLRFGLLP